MAFKNKVAIVGGGVAGSLLTKYLQDAADVTLIDPKDYCEVPYAALRCLVEPNVAERSCISHEAYMKKSKLVMSQATEATRTEVITDMAERIPFDYLVICTGSAYVGPRTRQERIDEYQTANRKLATAQKLLIIGGGPVGVELAGEIITDFPEKKVTIVTSSPRLLEFLGPNVSDKTLNWLQSMKVEVIFNDMVDPSAKDGNIYTTRAGKKIEAELHFWCVGKRLGNAWLQNSEFKNWCDDKGRLKVDRHLRLVDIPNVFCAGDMTDIPVYHRGNVERAFYSRQPCKEIKQGYLAKIHTAVIAKNIKKLIKDPKTKKLKTYDRLKNPFGIVTLGRHVAIAQMSCCSCIGRFPALFKNKDLFVSASRKDLGLSQ